VFFDPTSLVNKASTPPATVATSATNTIDSDKGVATVAEVATIPSQPYESIEQALYLSCLGLPIEPDEVLRHLSTDDIEDWHKGEICTDVLTAFARSLIQRQEMDQGKRPAHYTEHASCKHCGPIWLWFFGKVDGCPWCWNRKAGKPIPRPVSVHCGNCIHFERTNHPHLGHCAKGEPEAIAGLWDSDQRYCEHYLPRPALSNHNHVRPIGAKQKREFPK